MVFFIGFVDNRRIIHILEKPMQCFIYKSLKKQDLYLYITKKGDFSAIPEDLFKSIGEPVFVMDLALNSEQTLARVDINTVRKTLKDQGFFVQMPPVYLDLLKTLH